MLSGAHRIVNPIARLRSWITLCFLLTAIDSANASGSFVSTGEPRPEPDSLQVASGKPVSLDLLTSVSLPPDNQCRTTLYALGGTIAAKISEQTGSLRFTEDGKNSYRTSLTVEIPPAKAGARFIIKTDCLSPTPQLLGTIQLLIAESDPLDEIRAGLEGHEVQINGRSPKLRAVFEEYLIAFKDRTSPIPGAFVFSEGTADIDPSITTTSYILVELSTSSEHTFSLIGRKLGNSWKVEASLPRPGRLTGPEGASQLAQIIRFIHKLEVPPPDSP